MFIFCVQVPPVWSLSAVAGALGTLVVAGTLRAEASPITPSTPPTRTFERIIVPDESAADVLISGEHFCELCSCEKREVRHPEIPAKECTPSSVSRPAPIALINDVSTSVHRDYRSTPVLEGVLSPQCTDEVGGKDGTRLDEFLRKRASSADSEEPVGCRAEQLGGPTVLVTDGINYSRGNSCDDNRKQFEAALSGTSRDLLLALVPSVDEARCKETEFRCDQLDKLELPERIACVDLSGNTEDWQQTVKTWRSTYEGCESVARIPEKSQWEVLLEHPGRQSEDVLLVGTQEQLHCSGILVSPRAVLTARHCLPATRVVADVGGMRTTFAVVEAKTPDNGLVDLALLRLERAVEGVPIRRRRRESDTLPPQGAFRFVGFGARNSAGTGQFGQRASIDLPASGWGCAGRRIGYSGCRPEWEMVVPGSLGRDSCSGDSGGPLLELFGDGAKCGWRLVGVTSRSVNNARTRCGSGGVYTRVDRFAVWVDGWLRSWGE